MKAQNAERVQGVHTHRIQRLLYRARYAGRRPQDLELVPVVGHEGYVFGGWFIVGHCGYEIFLKEFVGGRQEGGPCGRVEAGGVESGRCGAASRDHVFSRGFKG